MSPNIYSYYSWVYQCLHMSTTSHPQDSTYVRKMGWLGRHHLGPRTKPFRLSRSELLDWCTVERTVSMERPNLGTLGTRDGCDRKKTMGSGTTCRETI